jgi:FemAB-related protein (PEP-CTERM system-associated)
MKLKLYNNKYKKKWDQFLSKSDDSTYFHTIEYKEVLEKSYGLKSQYYFVEDKNKICGIFPNFQVGGGLFSKKLISQPFAPYGGFIIDQKTKNKTRVRSLFLSKYEDIMKRQKIAFMELKSNKNLKLSGLKNNNIDYSLVLKLEDKKILYSKFSKSIRRILKKDINSELEFIYDSTDIHSFYKIYSKSMKDKGSPVHSFLFFNNLFNISRKNIKICLIKYDSKIISVVMLITYNKNVVYSWGATLKKYKYLAPSYKMFWEIIQKINNKYDYLDFGKSQIGSGTYKFKKKWSAKSIRLYKYYFLNLITEIPDISQKTLKRKIFSKTWKYLPVFMANRLGPLLRKNIA